MDTTQANAGTFAPSHSVGPIDLRERIQILDALRGFALFGVLAANIEVWFSGTFFLPADSGDGGQGTLDSVASHVVAILIGGKFISIFSFLFGLGFAVQMMRAKQRGTSALRLHSRRLAGLALFGIVHAVLLWYGDILAYYALVGLGLLAFAQRSDKTLLAWAGVLLVVVPLAMGWFALASAPSQTVATADATKVAAQENAAYLDAFRAGDYARVVSANLKLMQTPYKPGPIALGLFVRVFGLFLLGLWVGRLRLFETVDEHRALFIRVCRWGLGFGLLASVAPVVVGALDSSTAGLASAAGMARALGGVPLALGYVATLTLLFQRPAWRVRIAQLAPIGRMALTNYLSQTVICLFIFYGYGLSLMGETGAATNLAITCIIFMAQAAVSGWWMRRHRFGPMEWLWRTLTYGAAQPMRVEQAPATSSS